MAKIELEGIEELIDKVNKIGSKGDEIKKNTLDRAGKLVKEAMEKKAPRSSTYKRHMADYIKISDIENKNGVDFVKIGPDKGDVSEFYYSKFTEWGTSKIPAQHWASKSVQENRRTINAVIKDELERGLKEFDK